MEKIRLARIITRLNVGGPAYQATLLNHLLKNYGYDTLLIYGSPGAGEVFHDRLLKEYPGRTYFCKNLQPRINPFCDLAALFEIVKVLREFKPDIIHTHTSKAGLLGRTAGKIIGAKGKILVHTYHGHVLEGYFSKPVEKLIISTEKLLAGKTDCLIAVSQKLAHELSHRFKIAPDDKFIALDLGLPLDRFTNLPQRGKLRSRLSISEHALVLGSLGRLVPVKNFSRMLEVFRLVKKQFPDKDLHLIIGGTGPLENKLKKTVSESGLIDIVHFPGLIRDLPAFYADTDIVILTSDNEGTPVLLLEAQAAGKYVIAPDVGGIKDVLYAQCGWLIYPNKTGSYVEALSEIISNWPRNLNSCEQIRPEIIDRFSPDRLAKNIDRLYRKLLNGK